MSRLLFWIALIAVAIWLWQRTKNPVRRVPDKIPDAPPMVRCAHCSMHVPQLEALTRDGLWYCSSGHLEQGPCQRDQ